MGTNTIEKQQLHVSFFPYMAPGHMMPMIDMARLFAAHGVQASIIITHSNASRFQSIIDRDIKLGRNISLQIVNLPCQEVGIPNGCENIISADTPEITIKLFKAIDLLQPQVESLLCEIKPNCIISDGLYHWTVGIAQKLNIPRIAFSGSCFFSDCLSKCIRRHMPHHDVQNEAEEFVVPNLPDKVNLTKSQLPDLVKGRTDFSAFFEKLNQAEKNSFGVIMNSFYELEPSYVDYFKYKLQIKSWHVGPLLLYNQLLDDKSQRGDRVSLDSSSCLNWLDHKKTASVLYICFGSLIRFTRSQIIEVASALEDSGQSFIWVVPKLLKSHSDGTKCSEEWWLPDKFVKRMASSRQGLTIRGWAPQVLILEHPSIGGFLTHCGWNSIIESVCSGVPLITWPIFAEQFYNEKLVTQVVRFGVGVGNLQWKVWATEESPLIGREKIRKAIVTLMSEGREMKEMREKVKVLGGLAKRAVEEGGSSYKDLQRLFEDIRTYDRRERP